MLRHHIREFAQAPDSRVADEHFREILALVVEDPVVRGVLKAFKAGKPEIRELFDFLIYGGADRWIHGDYAAARSIANPVVLYAYLRDRHKRDDRSFQLGFADSCIRFLEGGFEPGFLLKMLSVPAGFEKDARAFAY